MNGYDFQPFGCNECRFQRQSRNIDKVLEQNTAHWGFRKRKCFQSYFYTSTHAYLDAAVPDWEYPRMIKRRHIRYRSARYDGVKRFFKCQKAESSYYQVRSSLWILRGRVHELTREKLKGEGGVLVAKSLSACVRGVQRLEGHNLLTTDQYIL